MHDWSASLFHCFRLLPFVSISFTSVFVSKYMCVLPQSLFFISNQLILILLGSVMLSHQQHPHIEPWKIPSFISNNSSFCKLFSHLETSFSPVVVLECVQSLWPKRIRKTRTQQRRGLSNTLQLIQKTALKVFLLFWPPLHWNALYYTGVYIVVATFCKLEWLKESKVHYVTFLLACKQTKERALDTRKELTWLLDVL